MLLKKISEDGIRVLTGRLDATFTFTRLLLTDSSVISESKCLRKLDVLVLAIDIIRCQPMFNLCCNFCIFLKAFWQHKILILVLKHETEDRNSHSRLEARD